MAESNRKSLTLRSSFENIERIEPFVDELQQWAEFSDDVYGNIMLALSEAVTNAILHGNQQDESKMVQINARQKKSKLVISIKDEGEGFDPATLPNPLQDENLLKEGGRGVYLIEQYSDDVTYSEGDTKITIEFMLE
ncbi:MAG: ATP-binding protein [Balneolaceae bacterium]|nr:ATP-binding protein [Balneolaceae bacterium]